MMSGPSVYFSWPTTFQLLPESLPQTLPSPVGEGMLRSPFGIDKTLYNAALRPEISFTFASIYIGVVLSLNAYNRRRSNAPWWISRQWIFRYFVVVHNVFLALFSFATFAAMWRAISHTFPGWEPAHPAASIADALCKLHGPRGIGDAAAYNTTINIWEAKNTSIRLGFDGNPDSTDVGRLWNEGLAFWGWFFYLSKFYEVIDTLIILAKGKRSATLQTYHHAGAMLCMWAGIRYMSPPIWMFVFINSGIHAMMYTYFTLSALGYKVPQGLKRTLTSLQITQFVFGASYAALHLFVQYDIPISTPYQIVSAVERAVSSASSAASSFVAPPTASPDWINLAKKLLLRAAGEEGPAERIGMDSKSAAISAIPAAAPIVSKVEKVVTQVFETRYRKDWTRVNCIDTSGEAFAIYLNLLYLAPLTWLFARFFIKAYTLRGKARSASNAARDLAASAHQAKKATKGSVERTGAQAEDAVAKGESKAEAKGKEVEEQVRRDLQAVRDGTFSSTTVKKVAEQVSEQVANVQSSVESAMEQATEEVKRLISGSEESTISETVTSIKESITTSSSQILESLSGASKEEGVSSTAQLFGRQTPTQTKSLQTSSGSGLFRSPGVDDEDDPDVPSATASAVKEDDPFVTSTTIQTSTASLSASEQDSNLASSQPVRPDPEEDSDAMGRSGVNIEESASS